MPTTLCELDNVEDAQKMADPIGIRLRLNNKRPDQQKRAPEEVVTSAPLSELIRGNTMQLSPMPINDNGVTATAFHCLVQNG